MKHPLLAAPMIVAIAASAAACAQAETGTTTIDAPSEMTYKPVGDFLVHRCGTLDCHGQVGRNLRLYGYGGLRLGAMDTPDGVPTTPDEYQADYNSVIGLEPEILSEVVMAGGQDPTRLRLLSKPMGLLEHKGGTLITMNDAQYTCVVSWLAQNVDTMACQATLSLP
jgi:hypothetical protein